jgi:hypothetical protein
VATPLTASVATVPQASSGPLCRVAPKTTARRSTVPADPAHVKGNWRRGRGEHGDIRAVMARLVDGQAGPASIPSRTWLAPGTSSQKGSSPHQLVAC